MTRSGLKASTCLRISVLLDEMTKGVRAREKRKVQNKTYLIENLHQTGSRSADYSWVALDGMPNVAADYSTLDYSKALADSLHSQVNLHSMTCSTSGESEENLT